MRNSIGNHHSFDCDFAIPRRPITDNYIDLEEESDEENEDQEFNLEMGCPYCSEGFDALELCVHLEDQHPLQTKSGVCPLCATNLGRNMISHLIIQHESTLKSLCKRKLYDDDSYSIVYLLRKKLEEEHLRSLRKESSSTHMATDPFLLSFIHKPPQNYEHKAVELHRCAEPSLSEALPKEETLQGDIQDDPLALQHQEEKAWKCDFVQAILFSTIFPDYL